jgi:hypothetical protein
VPVVRCSGGLCKSVRGTSRHDHKALSQPSSPSLPGPTISPFHPALPGMMLPSSVRRVVSAAPQSTLLSTFAPTAARATVATALNPRNQQRRRYSSSKPSNPNDSPKRLPAGQMTASPAESSKPSQEKPSGEKRKRKPKEITELSGRLPSVPSTHHVPQACLSSYICIFGATGMLTIQLP